MAHCHVCVSRSRSHRSLSTLPPLRPPYTSSSPAPSPPSSAQHAGTRAHACISRGAGGEPDVCTATQQSLGGATESPGGASESPGAAPDCAAKSGRESGRESDSSAPASKSASRSPSGALAASTPPKSSSLSLPASCTSECACRAFGGSAASISRQRSESVSSACKSESTSPSAVWPPKSHTARARTHVACPPRATGGWPAAALVCSTAQEEGSTEVSSRCTSPCPAAETSGCALTGAPAFSPPMSQSDEPTTAMVAPARALGPSSEGSTQRFHAPARAPPPPLPLPALPLLASTERQRVSSVCWSGAS
mmetsp:Transcript_28052/g.69187  ORF Transcript_28052/g.69187 Transcript_28052/m.69187 type:complete len:309 (-) Transcript_28052:1043-1969(-)